MFFRVEFNVIFIVISKVTNVLLCVILINVRLAYRKNERLVGGSKDVFSIKRNEAF